MESDKLLELLYNNPQLVDLICCEAKNQESQLSREILEQMDHNVRERLKKSLHLNKEYDATNTR